MAELTPRQQLFVDEYLVDLNATQAAIRAGLEIPVTPAGCYYTYLLIDPRSGRVFYIGKGKGKRVFTHVQRARRGHVDNAEKFKIISQIIRSGVAVTESVFSIHEKEADAFSVERKLIQAFKQCGIANIHGGIVTNKERRELEVLWNFSRLKSFPEWIRSVNRRQLETALLIGETPFIAYMKIRLQFLELMKAARC